jgi:AcrR family transcriptional regulator
LPFKTPRKPAARPAPRKGRRSAAPEPYHHGNLREALLEAGIQLLKEQGAEALGLRELARQAGVSRTAPYRHFESRDALLAGIAEQGFVKLREVLLEARREHEADHEAWFIAAARAYIGFAFGYAEHFKLMFGGYMKYEPGQHTSLHDAGNGAFQTLVDLVLASQESGLVMQGDPIAVSIAAWSTLHGFCSLAVHKRLDFLVENPELLSRTAELVARTCLEGVRARK